MTFLRVSLFLYPECAGKGECWASQSHQADSSSVIVTKKHFAKGHPEYCVLSPLIITVVVVIVVFFSILLMRFFFFNLIVDVMIYLMQKLHEKKRNLNMRYIWVEVHLNCRPVPHTSLEKHTKQRMAYVQVVVHVFF